MASAHAVSVYGLKHMEPTEEQIQAAITAMIHTVHSANTDSTRARTRPLAVAALRAALNVPTAPVPRRTS